MTLTEMALTLSIAASAIAVVGSLYGFARFVRRWWLRRYGAHPVDRWVAPASPIGKSQLGAEPDEGGGKLRRIQVSTRGRNIADCSGEH